MKNIITLVEQEKNQVDLKKKKKEKSIAIGREKNGLTACYDIFIALKRSENCPFSSACDGEGKADGSLNLDQERGGEMG